MADDFDRVKARLLLRLPEYLQVKCDRGQKKAIRCPFHDDRTPSAALLYNGKHADHPIIFCKSANCPQCGRGIDLFGAIQILEGLDAKGAWRWACEYFGEKVERTPRPQSTPNTTPRQRVIQYATGGTPEEIAAAEAALISTFKNGKDNAADNAAQTPTIAPQNPPADKVGQTPKTEPKNATAPRVSPYLTAALDFSQGEIFARVARILKKDNPTWTDAQIQRRAAWEAEMQFYALRGKAVTPFGD